MLGPGKIKNLPEVGYCALPLIGPKADCERGVYHDLEKRGGDKSLVGVNIFLGCPTNPLKLY